MVIKTYHFVDSVYFVNFRSINRVKRTVKDIFINAGTLTLFDQSEASIYSLTNKHFKIDSKNTNRFFIL